MLPQLSFGDRHGRRPCEPKVTGTSTTTTTTTTLILSPKPFLGKWMDKWLYLKSNKLASSDLPPTPGRSRSPTPDITAAPTSSTTNVHVSKFSKIRGWTPYPIFLMFQDISDLMTACYLDRVDSEKCELDSVAMLHPERIVSMVFFQRLQEKYDNYQGWIRSIAWTATVVTPECDSLLWAVHDETRRNWVVSQGIQKNRPCRN